MSSQSKKAPSKRAGEAIEAEVLQHVPQLEYVSDDTAEWYDARARDLITPTADLAFGSIVLLEVGTRVEIKAAQKRLNSGNRRGRFQFRRTQHDKLLDANASYLLAVYDPREKTVISMLVVPASIVDEFLPDGDWTILSRPTRDQTQEYCQRAWSRFISPREVDA